jgi:alpha-tubulin suppressor-like RCC1 family protein
MKSILLKMTNNFETLLFIIVILTLLPTFTFSQETKLFTSGYNAVFFLKKFTPKYGEIGDGTTTQRLTPTLVTSSSGTLNIYAGIWHTFIVKNDSTIYSFGRNDVFQKITINLSATSISTRNNNSTKHSQVSI